MILAFTEEQRKEIEARGMTVIQAKKILYNAADWFSELWDKVRNIIKGMSAEDIRRILEQENDSC